MMAADRGGIVREPGGGQMITPRPGWDMVLKVAEADTAGTYALLEMMVAPAAQRTPVHTHPASEGFYILEGECIVQVGDRIVQAPAGSFVLVPGGVVHAISNEGAEPARVLLLISPAGMERYFVEAAEVLSAAPAGGQPDIERIKTLRRQYGIADV